MQPVLRLTQKHLHTPKKAKSIDSIKQQQKITEKKASQARKSVERPTFKSKPVKLTSIAKSSLQHSFDGLTKHQLQERMYQLQVELNESIMTITHLREMVQERDQTIQGIKSQTHISESLSRDTRGMTDDEAFSNTGIYLSILNRCRSHDMKTE